MKLVARFYREYVLQHWRAMLMALVITAVINQTPYAFSMLGKWLVDDVLAVGKGAAKTVQVEKAESNDEQVTLVEEADEPTTAEASAPDATVADEQPKESEKQAKARMTRQLWIFLAISIGLHFAVSALGGLAGLFTSSTGQRVLFRLRNHLHRQLTTMPMSYYDRNQTGQLMVRVLDDANAAQANTVNLPVNVMTNIITLGVGIVLLFKLNATMTWITMGVLPFYAVGTAIFMGALRRNTEQVRIANADMQSSLEEKLVQMPTVKFYGREQSEALAFLRIIRKNLKITYRQNALNTGLSVVLMIISGVGATLILAYGFWQLKAGVMQLGAVLAFYQMTSLLFGPLTALMNTNVVIQTTGVVLERVYEVLDSDSTVKDEADAEVIESPRGEIEFRNVSLRYTEAGPIAVRNVTFHLPAGHRMAILGTSGSGRTTLANLLLRFYDPDEGEILFDGKEIRHLKLSSLRTSMGLASQDARIFSDTVAKNIAFGDPDATMEQIERVAKLVHIHEQVMQMPKGYDTRIGRGGESVDLSLIQRLAIARALLSDPAVILFDDSTSALSDDEETMLYDAINDAFEDRTEFIITNRVGTAQTADLILFMREGEIVEQGSHEELLAAKSAYWRMYLHQTNRPIPVGPEHLQPV